MTRNLRIAFVGFGNVGRRVAELLGGRYGRVLREHGVRPRVTGIATARHGIALDASGIPLPRGLSLARRGSLGPLHRGRSVADVAEFIDRVPADVLVELTTLDPKRGEPATSHVRRALGRGLHVVTANKGPVAFALAPLRALARRKGRLFLHEGAVMDGTPLFNLVDRCLPGVRVLGFRGTLNSTTTRILSRMEEGMSPEDALREAQAAGVAEADPSHDLEGWDAAVKGCAIANALMGAALKPPDVERTGISAVTPQAVLRAVEEGRRVRLVTRGRRSGRAVRVSVAPEPLPAGDLLAAPDADGAIVFETDLMGEIGVLEGRGSVDQTAYAILSDLVAVAAAHPRGAPRAGRRL